MHIKGLAATALILGGMVGGIFLCPVALATPGNCGGGGFIGGGSYCDGQAWPDGSFQHCTTAWGPFAWNQSCDQVCDNGTPFPTITDYDPRTPC